MDRKKFLQLMTLTPLSLGSMDLLDLKKITDDLPKQSKKMPVIFSSHGNPMDIPLTKEERPFWKALNDLGLELQNNYEVKGVMVVSAHWCTKGTYVNISETQQQIFDFYGFPDHYYQVKYNAKGSPELAKEVKKIVPNVQETSEWGLDHGAWPMLMHLFPKANLPVFQMSIDYYAKPNYHYELGKQLKSLREKGILIIGSGSLIHNLSLAIPRISSNNLTPFGWEVEYDAWLKQQIDTRNFNNLINYETSHTLGSTASPTPDHFVPLLYSLGLMEGSDQVTYFYDKISLPAFSERSFIIKSN
jgi:4,5-DOPA dioxygenase extradiol